jgi:hypothetical protein
MPRGSRGESREGRVSSRANAFHHERRQPEDRTRRSRKARPRRYETAALRDSDPAYDRSGSCVDGA